MQLEFAAFSEQRDTGLPEARLVNMFPEVTKAGPGRSARLSRPGLVQAYTLGTSGITGLYQQDGVFDGNLFAVAGTGLYRGETLIGTVALDTIARFAASPTQLVVVTGGSAYCYDGSTLTFIDVDGQTVIDVVLIGDRFYYLVEDDDQWYFSDIDDATSVDGLAFATADAQPDASVGAAVQGDQVIFFGRTSTEFWHQTGDQDAPLIRSQGTTYTRGCASAKSIVRCDNRWFWVGDDLKIYTLGAPTRVSTHAIEEQLRKCETPERVSAFACTWDGNDFVVFTIPGRGSWGLHIESGEWAEWTSHLRTAFRCATSTMIGGTAYLGDTLSGAIFSLEDVYTDDGDPIERIATVTAPPGLHGRIELEAATGVGLEDNSVPQVEMRYSENKGRTWGAWRSKSLGLIGVYDQRVRWDGLGLAKRPRNYQVRCTDPVKVTFVSVEADIR